MAHAPQENASSMGTLLIPMMAFMAVFMLWPNTPKKEPQEKDDQPGKIKTDNGKDKKDPTKTTDKTTDKTGKNKRRGL